MTRENKKVNIMFKSILIILSMFLLLPLASAELTTFDNTVKYDETLLKADINNLFGLGTTYGSIELKSHKSVDEIKQVGYGDYEPVMYYDFTNWELYENGLGNVYFTDMRTGKETEKLWYFAEWKEKTKEVPVYSKPTQTLDKNGTIIYNKEIIEYETETYWSWEKYNSKDIPNTKTETKRIALMVYVEKDDYTDAVWTVAGKKISEHASWSSSLETNIMAYYTFDGKYGINQDDDYYATYNATGTTGITNTTGKIGSAYTFSSGYIDLPTSFPTFYDTDFSISYWAIYDACGTTNTRIISRSPTVSFQNYNGILEEYYGGDLIVTCDTGVWTHMVYTYDVDTGTGKFYKNYADETDTSTAWAGGSDDTSNILVLGNRFDHGKPHAGKLDEIGFWSRTLSASEVQDLYNSGAGLQPIPITTDNPPSVVINSPDNYDNLTTSTETFEAVVTDDWLIQNVSLMQNGTIIETNTSQVNGTYTFSKSDTAGFYNWSIIAYDNNFQVNVSAERFYTISINAPEITLSYPPNNLVTSTATQNFYAYVTDDFKVQNVSYYLDSALQETNTDGTNATNYSFSDTLTEGSHTWYIEAYDNDSNPTTSATRTLTIDTIYPQLYANNITNQSTDSLPINTYWSYGASDANIDKCYYNTSQNTTYVIVTCNSTIGTQIVSEGDKEFYYCANDSVGHETCAHGAYNLFPYTSIQEQSSTTVTEGSDITFTLYVNSTNIPDTTAFLTYNNTNYTVIKTEYPDYTKFVRTVTVPTGWGSAAGVNQSANWSFSIQGYPEVKLPNLYNTVYKLTVDNCGANTVMIYNFTVKDEKSQVQVPALASASQPYVQVDLDIRRFTSSIILVNYSATFNGTNPIGICTNLQITGDLKYSVYGVVSYKTLNKNQSLVPEFYNIQNFTLQNSTAPQTISLYGLDNDSSQTFKITYKDENLIPVSSALIQVQRFYINEGLFRVVEIPITDPNGETLAHLEQEDVVYNFWIYKEGVLLAVLTDQLAKCDNEVLDDCNINLKALSSTTPTDDFITLDDFTFNFVVNKTTRTMSSTFNVPSGASAVVVINATVKGTLACTDTTTQITDTVTCTIPITFGNETAIVSLWKDGVLIGTAYVSLQQDPEDIFEGNQVFLILLLYFTIFGFAVSDNPMVTGFMFMIGAILGIMINVINTGESRFIGYGATFLWLVIAIIIVTVKAGRRT